MAIFRRQAVAGADAVRAVAPSSVAAASSVPPTPESKYVYGGVALVVVGAIAGWLLYKGLKPADFVPKSDYSVFAGLFILAGAIERLLEPFTRLVGPDTTETKQTVEGKVAAALQPAATTADVQAAADGQGRLDRERKERAFLLWGIASALAILACASLGLFMLRAVADVSRCDPRADSTAVTEEPGLRTPRGCADNDPNRFIDLLATGLIVGAGTKPLHDLVTRIQANKEKAVDSTATG